MFNSLKIRITHLISLYEAEKAEKFKLLELLDEKTKQVEAYKKQINELEKKIDNQTLTDAFTATSQDTAEAKKKIDFLVKEIDKCISLIEG